MSIVYKQEVLSCLSCPAYEEVRGKDGSNLFLCHKKGEFKRVMEWLWKNCPFKEEKP